ncbi:hypothetical protein ACLB2K_046863 [Fragaria x ananassa]
MTVARSIASSLSSLLDNSPIIVALSLSSFFSRAAASKQSCVLSLSIRATSALSLSTMSYISSCVRSRIVPSGVICGSFVTGAHSSLSSIPLVLLSLPSVLSPLGHCNLPSLSCSRLLLHLTLSSRLWLFVKLPTEGANCFCRIP